MNGEVRKAPRVLLPYQAEFVEWLVGRWKPGAAFGVVGPVGSGKTVAVAETIGELTRRSGVVRVLVLSPAMLVEQWHHLLGDTGLEVAALTPAGYRLMREHTGPTGFLPDGLYVMSIDFAKKPDVAQHLAHTPWDLLAVDEAHNLVGQRGGLVRQLRESTGSALLLATATPSPTFAGFVPKGSVANWRPTVAALMAASWQEGSLRDSKEVVAYERSATEVGVLARLTNLAGSLGPKGESLLRRAASSFSALEIGLNETLTSNVLTPEGRSALEELLGDVEQLDVDTQWECASKLVNDLLRREERHVVVFSDFIATAHYVASMLDQLGLTSYLESGSMSPAERDRVWRRFTEDGGILVRTSALADMPVLSLGAVIHYDIPRTAMRFALRERQYRQFGRTRPCTVYLLLDTSGALPGSGILHELLTTDPLMGSDGLVSDDVHDDPHAGDSSPMNANVRESEPEA